MNKRQINYGNLTEIVIDLMMEADKVKGLRGEEKKQRVLHILNDIIIEEVEDEAIRQGLLTVAKLTVPPMIDYLVKFSKNRYKFNKDTCSCFQHVFSK